MARTHEKTVPAPGGIARNFLTPLRRGRGGPAVFLALLAAVWLGLPLAPEETGLRFGIAYQVFFTALVVAAALFFWLLGRERVPQPRTTTGVLASVVGVYLVTVGLLVGVGVVYPQFARPRPPQDLASLTPVERGKALFWSPDVGCFRCHTMDGSGGTRAPDLTEVRVRAGRRVPDLTAEQYLRGKIQAGLTYDFKVPGFAPIMPPFKTVLSDAQLDDVIAYLTAPR
jgi:mono/diheme cytochrome c family protein